MECNKEEAIRAREIADSKFKANDFAGAKRFALKAQSLYPALDGIERMIATLDVHLASAPAVAGGERDWYAILSVGVGADEEVLRRQYKKLALLLHPDKNKSVGADRAFQLVSEAWTVLSDKAKRVAFEQKRNVTANGVNRCAPSAAKAAASNANASGSTKCASPPARAPQQNPPVPPPLRPMHTPSPRRNPVPPPPRPPTVPPTASNPTPSQPEAPAFKAGDTFWTRCKNCNMIYQHFRIYVNSNLLCSNCHKTYHAEELTMPQQAKGAAGAPQSHAKADTKPDINGHKIDAQSRQFVRPSVPPGVAGYKIDAQCPQFVRPSVPPGVAGRKIDAQSRQFVRPSVLLATGAASSRMASSSAANARSDSPIHPKNLQAAVRREEALQRRYNNLKRTAAGLNQGPGDGNLAKTFKVADGNPESTMPPCVRKTDNDNSSKFGASEAQPFMTRMAAPEIGAYPARVHVKFSNTFSPVIIKGMLISRAKNLLHERCINVTIKKQKLAQNVEEKAVDPAPEVRNNKEEHVDELQMFNVPDADFHDFDEGRSEESFKNNQVWAVYDDEDGMPRYYAFIQQVISVKPFKVRMSFLTSRSNAEFAELNWVSSGFSKTCGDFRIGRCETKEFVNMFSHKVRWQRGPNGIVKVLPMKGDIWALYRNWSPDWDEHTPDDVLYVYDLVEIVGDYSEDKGILVAPLVKVPGFICLFRQVHSSQTGDVRTTIPKNEMFRLSHQVPFYQLSGDEADGVPKDCFEVDPAALSKELLEAGAEESVQE